jgi:hypothetical protein
MTNILIVNPDTTSSMTETIGVAAPGRCCLRHKNNSGNFIDGTGLDRRFYDGRLRCGIDPGVSGYPDADAGIIAASMTRGLDARVPPCLPGGLGYRSGW